MTGIWTQARPIWRLDPQVPVLVAAIGDLRHVLRRVEARRPPRGFERDRVQGAVHNHLTLAVRMLVVLEDRYGVERLAGSMDAVTELRQQAMAAGLITPGQISALEDDAIRWVDADRDRRAAA